MDKVSMRMIFFVLMSSILPLSAAWAEDARQRELIGLWRAAANCQIPLAPAVGSWVEAMINSSDGGVTGEAVDGADKEFSQHVAAKQVITFCWTTRDRLKAVGLL